MAPLGEVTEERAVVTQDGLSNRDDAAALRAARRIIELAWERDPERLRAVTLSWVTE
jgi:hypothetical protein